MSIRSFLSEIGIIESEFLSLKLSFAYEIVIFTRGPRILRQEAYRSGAGNRRPKDLAGYLARGPGDLS